MNLCCGIAAGIIVSLLTRPEPSDRTDQFFLLLKTPVGQEHILREAGFPELPGADTFDLPADVPHERQSASVGEALPGSWSAPCLAKINNVTSRRQSIYGFIALTFVTLAMLAGVKLMAMWLSR